MLDSACVAHAVPEHLFGERNFLSTIDPDQPYHRSNGLFR
jgi:hypothetical protein